MPYKYYVCNMMFLSRLNTLVTLQMKQNVLFVVASETVHTLPRISDCEHYQWVHVVVSANKCVTYEKLSQLWYEQCPVAVYTYGPTDRFYDTLNYLYKVRKCWVHLDTLPDEINLTCNVFYNFLDKKRDEGSPTLSVITSTYKSGHKINRPLKSLQNQTYPNWEWIIWDDSPDDDLYKWLVQAQERDMRIQVYRAPRPSGVIGLMKRRSASLATGEFLVEVDHDDELHENLFQWIIDASRKYSDAKFFYTDSAEIVEGTFSPITYGDYFGLGYCGHRYEWCDKYNCYIAAVHSPPPNATTMSHIVSVPNHVRVWKTEFYNNIGKHNPYLPVGDDYELILRTFISGEKWCHIRACGYYQYRNKDGNFTFIRNSLIQHVVHHTYNFYAHDLPPPAPTDRNVPAWSLPDDEQPHPATCKSHYEYDPHPYTTTFVMIQPTVECISRYVHVPDSRIAIVGNVPDDIPTEWKRKIIWYDLKMFTDEERQLAYARNILHRGKKLVHVK